MVCGSGVSSSAAMTAKVERAIGELRVKIPHSALCIGFCYGLRIMTALHVYAGAFMVSWLKGISMRGSHLCYV